MEAPFVPKVAVTLRGGATGARRRRIAAIAFKLRDFVAKNCKSYSFDDRVGRFVTFRMVPTTSIFTGTPAISSGISTDLSG